MSTDASYLVDAPQPPGIHVCLVDLLERIRFEFDIASTSGRLTDAQLTSVINRSRHKLFQLLVGIDDAPFRADVTLTTAAGNAEVALPEAFYAPLALRYINDEGNERQVRRATVRDERIGPSSDAWATREPVYYVDETTIRLVPTPSSSVPLYMTYVRGFVDLVAAPGEPHCWDARHTWDEWVINDALALLCRRSRRWEDVAAFTSARDELTQRYLMAPSSESFEAPRFARRLMFRGEYGDEQ